MDSEEGAVKEVKLDASFAAKHAISGLFQIDLLPYLRPNALIRWVDEKFDLILSLSLREGGVPVTYIKHNPVSERYSVHWDGEDGFDYHGDFEPDLIAALEVRPRAETQ